MTQSGLLRTPVQSRAQKTRAGLVEAAKLEFSERGYAVTTAKSIAERASVGTGTFYHYFPDKDAVLREITVERVQSLLDETAELADVPVLPGTPSELVQHAEQRLRTLVELYIRYHRADRGLHAVISERRLCDPDLDAIMTGSEREAVLRVEKTLALWQREEDCGAAAFMMFSLLEGAVHAHVLGHPLLSDERFIDGLVSALTRIGMPHRLMQRAVSLAFDE